MLTDTELRKLKPCGKLIKMADRDGMYVAVSPAGTKYFRYDHRVNGRRETLTIGRYDEPLGSTTTRTLDDLAYGISWSLAEARVLLADARRDVELGKLTSRAKVDKRIVANDMLTFGAWADGYFADKAAVPIALGASAIGSLENRPSLSRFLPLIDKLGAVVLIVMGLYMLNANFFLIPGLAG